MFIVQPQYNFTHQKNRVVKLQKKTIRKTRLSPKKL